MRIETETGGKTVLHRIVARCLLFVHRREAVATLGRSGRITPPYTLLSCSCLLVVAFAAFIHVRDAEGCCAADFMMPHVLTSFIPYPTRALIIIALPNGRPFTNYLFSSSRSASPPSSTTPTSCSVSRVHTAVVARSVRDELGSSPHLTPSTPGLQHYFAHLQWSHSRCINPRSTSHMHLQVTRPRPQRSLTPTA